MALEAVVLAAEVVNKSPVDVVVAAAQVAVPKKLLGVVDQVVAQAVVTNDDLILNKFYQNIYFYILNPKQA